MQIFLFFSLFIAILAVVFAVQNTGPVDVYFLIWKSHGPLALVLLIALAAGVLISFFASMPSLVRYQLNLRTHRKKASEMESNISVYKSQLEEAQKKLFEHEQARLSEEKPLEVKPPEKTS
jgi:uncharacterized integral membrane protein